MNEILACGNWPTNSLADIRTCIEMLQQKGHIRDDFTVVASKNVIAILWKQIGQQFFTYLNYLESTKIVTGVITSDMVPDGECWVYATTDNMPFFVECNGIWVVKEDSIVKIKEITGAW